MRVVGTIQDGLGQGRSFTQLGWVREQFRNRVGFEPYPGTLNVHVHDTVALSVWRARQAILIEPGAADYCAARCYRVRIDNRLDAAWILPDVPGYPCDVIELMAPLSIRETLRLKTGDLVEIEFNGEIE